MANRTDEEFAAFVRDHSPRLQVIARGLCGDPHLAQDLAQQALEKAYLKWGRVRRADDRFAYVRRILVNVHHDRQRRRPWREQVTEHDLEPHGPGPDVPGAIADREAVRAALAELTPRERAVVVLRYADDLTEADTARELGIAVGTVKSACARALGKLRAAPGLSEVREA
ncbi:SigE family RNA polymerase sigma factor [Mariniluteicoccus flavus]